MPTPLRAGPRARQRAGQRARQSGATPTVAVVDLGGAKAACLVAALTPTGASGRGGDMDRVGAYEADILGVGQHGGGFGDRASSPEASLRAALEAAERMAGEQVRSVYVAVPGRSVLSRLVGVDLSLAGGAVAEEDVAESLRAGGEAASDGRAPLHIAPVRFFVDGEPAHGAPVGLVGDTLTTEVLGLSVRESLVANTEAVLNRCGLDLDALVAAPYAAAEAVLIPDEKELGAILVDIGARTTDFAVYDQGALVACGGVPLGGEHVTRDIAQIFGAPLAAAERVKTLYGSALAGAGDEHRLVDFPQLGDPSEVMRHSRAELSSVISPRLEEIFELTLVAAEKIGAGAAARRVVLTGGGGLLLGARETAERVFGAKARLGRPAGQAGAPDAATAPQFAAAMGVLHHVARTYGSSADGRTRRLAGGVPGWPGGWAGARAPKLIGDVGGWLRANF